VRRIFGYMGFAVGCLFVFLAPLLYLYTKPRVEKAPIDVCEATISVGSAKVLSPQVLYVVGPFPAENISIAKGNQKASSKDVAVINIFDRSLNVQGGRAANMSICDRPARVRTGQDFNYGLTVYAMDRASGEAVRCGCGETPGIRGLTLKFPFGTKKRNYPFYDSTARKPFPARYVRAESLEALNVYLFRSDVPATRIGTLDLPGGLLGVGKGLFPTERWYSATTSLWVEPVTGAIVKAGQVSSQWSRFQGKFAITLAQTSFENDQQSVGRTAELVRTKVSQLRLVELWMPFFGPVLGVVLIAVGLIFLRPLRPGRPAAQPARAEALA
jgi:DUF3068 family protein